jgi:hypothetical protein
VKLTLKSHDGKAIVKKVPKEERKGPLEYFTVGDRDNAIEVVVDDKHKNGLSLRPNHRFDDFPLQCGQREKFKEGNVVAVRRFNTDSGH